MKTALLITLVAAFGIGLSAYTYSVDIDTAVLLLSQR